MHPLTERILASLPGMRSLWIVAWALVPWLNAGLNLLLDTETAVWKQSSAVVVLSYAAVSFAVGMTLWGSGRIADRFNGLCTTTVDVLQDGGQASQTSRFGEFARAAAPIFAAAATGVAFGVGALVEDGWTSALLRGITWFVLGVPLWTFLWTYGSLQLNLDRLGREKLRPDAARIDPALGLRPLGDISFMALWMLLAWLVPLLLTTLPDVVGVVLGIGVLAGGLAVFFLSLLRLHQQMLVVKASELAVARKLYAEAYEPIRAAPTLTTLERQRKLLGAADALEQRARGIHDWPIDEGTIARVVTIATSVIAIAIGRLILNPLGL